VGVFRVAKSPKQEPRWQSNGPRIQHKKRKTKARLVRGIWSWRNAVFRSRPGAACASSFQERTVLSWVYRRILNWLETREQSQHRAFKPLLAEPLPGLVFATKNYKPHLPRVPGLGPWKRAWQAPHRRAGWLTPQTAKLGRVRRPPTTTKRKAHGSTPHHAPPRTASLPVGGMWIDWLMTRQMVGRGSMRCCCNKLPIFPQCIGGHLDGPGISRILTLQTDQCNMRWPARWDDLSRGKTQAG